MASFTGIPKRPLNLLIVEDNSLDVEILQRVLAKISRQIVISVVDDTAAATAHLAKHSPGAILLDLNLPGKDGHSFLTELKNTAAWRDIPVLIYSSTLDPEDRRRSLSSGALAFVQKPVAVAEFDGLAGALSRIFDRFAA